MWRVVFVKFLGIKKIPYAEIPTKNKIKINHTYNVLKEKKESKEKNQKQNRNISIFNIYQNHLIIGFHPTRHQLYGHLPPITKTIQVRRTRHAGHCWRSRDELISDVLLWTPTHGRAKAGRPARTYIQQLCEDTGCCPEDLPRR